MTQPLYMLEDGVIGLRLLTASDVTLDYLGWLNDPDVNRYLETRFKSWSLEEIESFVKEKEESPDEYLWGIFIVSRRRHVGNIKLGPINRNHRRADISLFVGDKDWWGKGIATRAIRLVTAFGFGTANLNKLQAGAYAPNEGSIRAFCNVGFVREGLIVEAALVDGRAVDTVLVGLSRRQWQEQGA